MANNNDVMLTTTDNPYNPFTQYDEWLAYDVQKGYNTNAYLARVCHTASAMSEEQEEELIDQAIDEIINLNILGIYIKVTENNFKDMIKFQE